MCDENFELSLKYEKVKNTKKYQKNQINDIKSLQFDKKMIKSKN